MLTEDFNHTIDIWIKELEQYNFIQLCARPSPDSWSLGQLYTHLLNETGFYIEQIKICMSTNSNSDGEASPYAKILFLNNDFPDKTIKGPASNENIPQPDNKEHLLSGLLKLKDEMQDIAKQIAKNKNNGKTKHPGLGYFNAIEWFQFSEMHFRHHVRQKNRIDEFLKISK